MTRLRAAAYHRSTMTTCSFLKERVTMIRRVMLLIAIPVLAGCHGPAKPSDVKGPATLSSLLVVGQTNFSSIGQSGQLTVFGNYSDGSRQDVTAQVVWSVQNTSVVTVGGAGLIKTIGYGSTSVTATLQSMTATATVRVTLTVTTVVLSATSVTLGAVGQTAQLMLTATYADGSTKDVSSEATWSSDTVAVASVANTGVVTANRLGLARITARFPPQPDKTATIVVTPPGTFAVEGVTRDPGNGLLSGVTIVHQASGQSTMSANGRFALAGLTGGKLSFDRSGYETAVVDTGTDTNTLVKSIDVPMQPLTRVDAGASVSRTIAPHDMDYLVGGMHCYPCQLVRVTTSSGGMLHVDVGWTNLQSTLHLWINGVQYPGSPTGPRSVSADVAAAAGEVLVYIGQLSNQNANYVTFTLKTEMR